MLIYACIKHGKYDNYMQKKLFTIDFEFIIRKKYNSIAVIHIINSILTLFFSYNLNIKQVFKGQFFAETVFIMLISKSFPQKKSSKMKLLICYHPKYRYINQIYVFYFYSAHFFKILKH